MDTTNDWLGLWVHFTFGAEGGIIGGAACEKGGGAREREV
jgi:hypothetical protein